MDEVESEGDGDRAHQRQLRAKFRHRREAAERTKRTRNAGIWILIIALMQIAFSLVFGLIHEREAAKTLRDLDDAPADAVYELAGEELGVEEMRARVEKERLQVFVVPIGLGVVFLGLFVWSKKSPLPAIGTALGLFVTVHALEVLFDPTSLFRGIVVKVFCVVVLVRGLKSAIEQRAIAMEEAEAEDADATEVTEPAR